MNFGIDWLNPTGVQQSGGMMDPGSPNFAGTGTGAATDLTTSFGDMSAYGKMGVVSQGLGAFSSLAQIYAGFKAMKLAKDQFKFQKEAWNKNYQAGVKDYENTLKDKWAARSASAAARGTDFQSMSSYVDPRKIDKTVTAPTG
jgi:hypothetical protein